MCNDIFQYVSIIRTVFIYTYIYVVIFTFDAYDPTLLISLGCGPLLLTVANGGL